MNHATLSPTLDLAADFGPPDAAEWMKLTESVLQGAPFEKKLVTRTPEGIAVQPLYGLGALDANPLADGTPGEYPYLRGTRAAGYRTRPWDICQVLPYATAAEFNAAAHHDLGRGLNALVITLDEAGKHGRDPGEGSGVGGTSLVTRADVDEAFAGIDFSDLPVHLDAGVSAPAAAIMLLDRPQGPTLGSACFDPLAILATDGELPMTLDRAWDLLTAHKRYLGKRVPAMRSVGVDVRWVGHAGGNAVQELACMLSSAAETFRALAARGSHPGVVARASRVRMAVGSDFFMEIAKLRAARALWAQLVRACGGDDEAAKLHLCASTSAWTQTKQDPYVNLLRGTSQAFAAVVAGVDGLQVDAFDALFGPPTEFSRRIARNIQLILRDEAHIPEVVDPAGGSWTIESLTLELARKAWAMFQSMEKEGGLLAALQGGALRERLAASAAERRNLLAQRREVMVGTNQYVNLDEVLPETRATDAVALAATRRESLAKAKAARDGKALQAALAELGKKPTGDVLASAVRLGASLGEISREVGGGEVSRVEPIACGRLTEGYEALRANVAALAAPPVAFLAQMGPVRQHKARADFTLEFLKPGGFRLVADRSFADPAEAARAAIAAGASLTVLCSTDETYPTLVPAFAAAVKAAAPQVIVLVAGLLPDHTEAFKAAGVDGFIHLRANNLEMLQDLHVRLGVTR
jgi:methylmalonyl-CoA mutase